MIRRQYAEGAPEAPSSAITEAELAFKRAVRRIIHFDLTIDQHFINQHNTAIPIERMVQLAIEAADDMQLEHLIELNSDPAAMDGAELTFLDVSDHDFDERTFRADNYDGLLKPLPDEA